MNARTKILVCQTKSRQAVWYNIARRTNRPSETVVSRQMCFSCTHSWGFFPKEKLIRNASVLKNIPHVCLFWNESGIMVSCRLQICCCLSKDLKRFCIRRIIHAGKRLYHDCIASKQRGNAHAQIPIDKALRVFLKIISRVILFVDHHMLNPFWPSLLKYKFC